MQSTVDNKEQHHISGETPQEAASTSQSPISQPKKRRILTMEVTKLSLLTAGLGAAIVLLLLFSAYAFLRGVSFNLPEVVGQSISNVFGEQLATDSNGDTNVLVIGIGGVEHDGPYLTDSIMLVNMKNSGESSVGMLSIPRDLYVSVPGVGGTKINGVYTLAMQKAARGNATEDTTDTTTELLPAVNQEAMNSLKETVERVTGVEIQYTVRIDFQGFIDVIDQVGGIEVEVPENFIDRQYPDKNQIGYETFFLREGLQTLDGETALKYARSRHSTSDFDRARRQQVIIKALLDKLISQEILTNPSQLRRIFISVSSNVNTDLSWRQILRLAGYAQKLPKDNIANAVLSDDPSMPGGVLYSPDRSGFGGSAVLLPTGATASNPTYYKDIQSFTYMYFNNPQFFASPPNVLVLNGTMSGSKRVAGIAGLASSLFGKYGIDVESGNAPAGVSLPQTTFFFYDKEDQKKHSANFQLFVSGKSVVVAPMSSTVDPNDPEGTLAAMLEENRGAYTAVIVVGNDYQQYLK